MAYTDNFPQRPIFSLDAANAGRLDPRCSFTRADTPPTYAAPSAVHYWSNEKHLSSENLFTNSEDFSAWTASNTTPTANAVAAPDGTTTADTITGTGTGSLQKSVQSNTISASYPVVSVYVKAGSHNYIQIQSDWSGSHYANFDVTSGAGAVGSLGGNTTATIQAVGSTGWYRCVCRYNAASMSPIIIIRLVDSASAAYGAATTTTGTVHLWGAMATGLGDLTNIVAYQPSTTSIHRQYAPTLKSVATAGQPRFEYDPSSDGQSIAKGILIEGAATNLLSYSDDFANQWAKTRTLASESAAVGPTGALNADLIYADGTAANTHLVQLPSTVTAAAHTFSVYAKSAGCQYIRLSNVITGSGYGHFDLINGTVTSSSTTSAIESVGNGWYRCSITETQTAGTHYGRVSLAISSGSIYWDGDNYSGVLLWNAQNELGSFASSAISTSGSAVTRAAESLSMTDSSLFDNGGGTLYAEASQNVLDTYNGVFAVSDGTGANTIEILGNSSSFRGQVVNANSTNASFIGGTITVGQFNKHALTFSSSEASYYVNGSEIGTTDSSVVIPTVSEIDIGNVAWSRPLNGHVRKVALYSEPISETAAAAITS